MFWLLFVILLILWLGGYFVFSLGNHIHILLVLALVVFIYNLLASRRSVP